MEIDKEMDDRRDKMDRIRERWRWRWRWRWMDGDGDGDGEIKDGDR